MCRHQPKRPAFPRHALRCLPLQVHYSHGVQLLLCVQAKLEKETQALQAKMEMAVYKERTPEAIKAEDSSKLTKLQAQRQTLQQALKSIEELEGSSC